MDAVEEDDTNNNNNNNKFIEIKTCIHLDAVEEHHTNVTSLPASYRMMSG